MIQNVSEKISYDLAKKLLNSIKALDSSAGDLDALYSRFDEYSNDEAKEEIRKILENLLSVSFDLAGSIVREHPSLDPDKNVN